MNAAETKVADAMKQLGWNTLRSGWPDFLCYRVRGGIREIVCIEVKDGTDTLSVVQQQMHELLAYVGIKVLTVRPEEIDALLANPDGLRPMGSRLADEVVSRLKREVRNEVKTAITEALAESREVTEEAATSVCQYWSIDEFAARMGISKFTVRRHIAAGKLRAVKVGARVLIPRDAEVTN